MDLSSVGRSSQASPPVSRSWTTGDATMRMTYRAARALRAIEQAPGASNGRVSELAGVADEGEMSRLLERLAGLGLVHDDGAGSAPGVPRVWRLTARGAEVERAVGRLSEGFGGRWVPAGSSRARRRGA